MSAERTYVRSHEDAFLADLFAWLRIPSVSADPAHHGDVLRSAEWLVDACRRTGFPTAEVWQAGGLPAVFAEWLSDDPEATTVLVYGHHDVQPAGDPDLWATDAFDPVVVDGAVLGRGASDDKGQVLAHLVGLQAHLAATGRPSPAVNLKLLIEGEEESGSPHLIALLERERDRLACDVVVISDTAMIASDVPSTVTGTRGLVLCRVTLDGPERELHSGNFGGAVPNPATALARLVAGLHDDQGRVQVPGFYDDVAELEETERLVLAAVPYDEEEFLRETVSGAVSGELGYTTVERIGARPTAEVNGIGGGYQGPGGKTTIPTSAFANLSFRLVSDQDPARVIAAVEKCVAERTPDGIRSSVEWQGHGVSPYLVDRTTPAFAALLEAIGGGFDAAEVLPNREGGSGPQAAIHAALDAPLIYLGFGLPGDRIHAPNESASLEMLARGAESVALLWSKL